MGYNGVYAREMCDRSCLCFSDLVCSMTATQLMCYASYQQLEPERRSLGKTPMYKERE